jgi:hypothetical protein
LKKNGQFFFAENGQKSQEIVIITSTPDSGEVATHVFPVIISLHFVALDLPDLERIGEHTGLAARKLELGPI